MADAARGARTARGASTSDCTTCTPVTWRGRRTRDSNRTARSPPARPPAMLCTSRVRSAARCLRGGRVRRHSAVPRRDRTFGWERPQLLGQPPTAQSPLHHVTPDAVACWMGVTRPSSLALAQARTTSNRRLRSRRTSRRTHPRVRRRPSNRGHAASSALPERCSTATSTPAASTPTRPASVRTPQRYSTRAAARRLVPPPPLRRERDNPHRSPLVVATIATTSRPRNALPPRPAPQTRGFAQSSTR